MVDNQILEAINGIKASVGSMEKQLKTFSTKADLNVMVGQIREIKNTVVENYWRGFREFCI